MDIFSTPLPEAVETLVSTLAADEDVRRLAAPESIPTTQGSYGRYLTTLPMLAEAQPFATSNVANLRFWAVVFDRAGGNRQGISSALQILGA